MSQLERLVAELRSFNHVIVIGPQRSGTRIASKILAEELKSTWIPEDEIDVDDIVLAGRWMDVPGARWVMQAPGLTHQVVLIRNLGLVPNKKPPAFVFMHRRMKDILRSERRIEWREHGHHEEEVAKYLQIPAFRKIAERYDDIAAVKLVCWQKIQRPALGELAFDLEYTALAEHRLWIPPARRKRFHAHQTQEASHEA